MSCGDDVAGTLRPRGSRLLLSGGRLRGCTGGEGMVMVTFGSADQAVYLEYARGCTTATGEETLLTKPAAHDYGEVQPSRSDAPGAGRRRRIFSCCSSSTSRQRSPGTWGRSARRWSPSWLAQSCGLCIGFTADSGQYCLRLGFVADSRQYCLCIGCAADFSHLPGTLCGTFQ